MPLCAHEDIWLNVYNYSFQLSSAKRMNYSSCFSEEGYSKPDTMGQSCNISNFGGRGRRITLSSRTA